jgi:hypothetical protein
MKEEREKEEEEKKSLSIFVFLQSVRRPSNGPWHEQTSAFSGDELGIAKQVYAFSPVTAGRIHKFNKGQVSTVYILNNVYYVSSSRYSGL